MFTMDTAAPAAVAASGILLAVTIAVAATALVALGSVTWSLQRSARLNRLTAGISAAIALVILVGASVIGGSLTRPPAALADEDRAPRSVSRAPIELKLGNTKVGNTNLGNTKLDELKLSGLQLPTL